MRRPRSRIGLFLIAAAVCLSAVSASKRSRLSAADRPKPSAKAVAKQLPPQGIEISPAQRAALQKELDALAEDMRQLEGQVRPDVRGLLPDVRIYWQAVQTALADGDFYNSNEIAAAADLLRTGRQRASALRRGEAPWTKSRGLVVRGYVSRLDGSVQPYGLVVPESYTFDGNNRFRLDFWFHGRDERLSEVKFIRDRSKTVGTFAPPNTIVLHPYGRYCNANKFAGEIDVLEALESVQQRYRVDADRIAVRGFSMGGASTWHLAVHYPDRWVAANPGAGFAETPKFAKYFERTSLVPTWWETKLFHLYDATDWAGNLWHCPTVAYSGEIDTQKQAADVMAEALKKEGLDLVHIIGPKTAHRYEPGARLEVDRRMAALAERGRQRLPDRVRFTTYTLRYNRCAWIAIDALDRHWERARIEARADDDGGFSVLVDNIAAFTVEMPSGEAPIRSSPTRAVPLRIRSFEQEMAGRPFEVVPVKVLTRSDRSFRASLHREGDRWVPGPPPPGLRKKHGLQGPIDDAFLEPFLIVRPGGQCASPEVHAWTLREMERAIKEWRRQFRGLPRVKMDRDVTPEDIATMNLILWGDAAANSLVARIGDKLPIRSQASQLTVDERRFDSTHHVPVLVHPNPLNPERTIVLNSGFTFRERAYISNAFQVPKLPDWAIVDVRTPADADWPGKIVAADFFDEAWQLRPPHREEAPRGR